MTDDEFLTAFENCTLPAEQWTHHAHVRVAYLYASRYDLPAAIKRVRKHIKAYNKATNTPEAIDRGYHETITLAFMQIVFAANSRTGPHRSTVEFCETHPELLTKFALQRYYSKERLMTMEAKLGFITPDLCPLPITVSDGITIDCVVDGEAIEQARILFTEYLNSLPCDLSYQHIDAELQSLPGKYAAPQGRLLIAYSKTQPAGCVAIRPIEDNICEMKRLWVRPDFRRIGLGKLLVETVIDHARSIGYRAVRLDTITEMAAAIALYRTLGFIETTAFTHNPFPSAVFMEKTLLADRHSERQ